MKKENENFLRMALEDLESSRILYEHKKYPQSIFLLQQSIEKTTKGTTGIFKHGHRTSNIYKSIGGKEIEKEIESLENMNINDGKTLLVFIGVIKSLLSELVFPAVSI